MRFCIERGKKEFFWGVDCFRGWERVFCQREDIQGTRFILRDNKEDRVH